MRIDNKVPLVVAATPAPISPTVPTARKRGRPRKPTATPIVDEKVHIIHILDSSGSMSHTEYLLDEVGNYQRDQRGNTIVGPTKYEGAKIGIVTELEKLSGDTTIDKYTLYEFGSGSESKYQYKGVSNEAALKIAKNLKHFRSGTALNDALGVVLSAVKASYDPKVKTLVSVLTDGEEIHSRNYTPMQIAKLIVELKGFGVTVTFAGTARDVETAINLYSIDRSNTVTHDNTASSIMKMSAVRTEATMAYSKNVTRGADVSVNFFAGN